MRMRKGKIGGGGGGGGGGGAGVWNFEASLSAKD